jgi:hypothetical protein
MKSIIQYRGIVAIPAEDILKLIEKGISLLAGIKIKHLMNSLQKNTSLSLFFHRLKSIQLYLKPGGWRCF